MDDRDQRIFVAIAAYREPELRLTIQSCIDNADHPARLTFGVCLQHDSEGPPEIQADCLDGLEAELRVLSYDWRESKGGCWARHLTQGLYEGERFTLQIDAHSRMEPGWDTDLIEMVANFPGDKPLITGFPPLYDVGEDQEFIELSRRDVVPAAICDQWSDEGWIWHPTVVLETETAVPRHTRFLSGAFVFTHGEWNQEVRQDPEHLYTGEEFALTIRSFTSGYDLYNPSKVVVWHRSHPGGNPKYIYDSPENEVSWRHTRALKRLRTLLRGDPDRILAPYSLGNVRPIQQYFDWAGLDRATRAVSEDARVGLAPVPIRALT